MLINYSSSNKEDKHDKITNTVTRKSADNSSLEINSTSFQTLSKTSGNMETQLGKSVLIEVNRGLVNALVLIRMLVNGLIGGWRNLI